MTKLFILITSPPACGKSRLAKRLASSLNNVVYLDKDDVIPLSKQIFKVGKKPYNRSSDFFQKNIRDYEYEVVINQGFSAIKYADSVIINAPFTQEVRDKVWIDEFRQRVEKAGAKLLVVWISATPELCKFRMNKRSSDRDKWKIENWDEYVKKVNFSVPSDFKEDELFIHKNSTDEEADFYFEKLLEKINKQ